MGITQIPFNQLIGLQAADPASDFLLSLPAGMQCSLTHWASPKPEHSNPTQRYSRSSQTPHLSSPH